MPCHWFQQIYSIWSWKYFYFLHKTTVCALAQHYYVHITLCFVMYRTAAIYTDSKITLDSLRNSNNHNYLIHEIRNKIRSLEVDSWIQFGESTRRTREERSSTSTWKQAARDENLPIAYERIPISAIQIELQKQSLEKWEREWKSWQPNPFSLQFKTG